ncbi:putative acid phosphatase SPBC4.06 [Golovinomyces cichoracearum]|uniref:3-phytase n=1 Tax=Golovinomyces cichoracearum TaxID=62708 RepID=A0A420IXR7_9PEZI|nr:putative acid phosphatase SPBC4.06 [Golovinomyces cichoracearum]
MTSIQARDPYTKKELEKLYVKDLRLQLVQVLHRHGERTPTVSRFQNAGLPRFWPYCSVAQEMISQTLDNEHNPMKWTPFHWQRRIETLDKDGQPILATGPDGDVNSLCKAGELTNKGRVTTLDLGRRLRHLYVDQLDFLPKTLEDADILYLRSSSFPRALESLQQVVRGLYPAKTRVSSLGPLSIITRSDADENLVPNPYNCKRLSQLSTAFAQRSADRWNKTTEMQYLNKLFGKWMPKKHKSVAVDSKPRLSGIYDSINSTLAHDPGTRLPDEFYDSQGRTIIDKICVEEWFSGYQESEEYRTLGIGRLMGEIVARMIRTVESTHREKSSSRNYRDKSVSKEKAENNKLKLALNGCHDSTLAAILGSLGTLKNKTWPPYTSHIALELFRKLPVKSVSPPGIQDFNDGTENCPEILTNFHNGPQEENDLSCHTLKNSQDSNKSKNISSLAGYFVRVRYNDEVVTIPGCTQTGNHLDGDETFCTLDAFKTIVGKYVPHSQQKACQANLDMPAFPETPQPAGY